VYIAGLGATTVSQTNFTNNTFLSNAANFTSDGGGGAVYLDGGITLFNGNTFQQNTANGYGGALVYIHECFPGATNISLAYSLQIRLSSLHLEHVTLQSMRVVRLVAVAQLIRFLERLTISACQVARKMAGYALVGGLL